jgi:hypothetical protein
MIARMIVKLGYLFSLLLYLLGHCLHFFSEFLCSFFSPIPLINYCLISLLFDSFYYIMFQIVYSLPKRKEITFDWFRIGCKDPQELFKFRWDSSSKCAYYFNLWISNNIWKRELRTADLCGELRLNFNDGLQNICYLLLLESIVNWLDVVFF